MALVRKCVQCGMDLTDTSATTCPMCGTRIVPALGMKIWIVALFQLGFATGFMLLFRFPKFMIAMFDIVILIGTAVSARLKTRPVPRPAVPRPTLHPVLFKVVSLLIAACAFALLAFLLLGSVMFANSLSLWQQYRNEPYHRTQFEVTRPYYQRSGKGHDIYASGTVEGRREWMGLMPYLHMQPRSEAELEERVPPGTVIRIYLFPQMKGRMRVRVDEGLPPADAYYQSGIKVLKNSLLGLALIGLAIVVLWRIRGLCFAQATPPFEEAVPVQDPAS